MEIESYLSFEGRTEEALGVSRQACRPRADDEDAVQGFAHADGAQNASAGLRDKVMHMSFRIGKTTLLASDGRCSRHAEVRRRVAGSVRADR